MNHRAGWKIGRSIMIELGLALRGLAVRNPEEQAEALADLARELPHGWRTELEQLLGPGRGPVSTLIVLAWLADVLESDDYTEATRQIREMDLPEVTKRMTQRAEAMDIAPDMSVSPPLRLARLWTDMARTGFDAQELPELLHRPVDADHPVARLHLLLRDGELHNHFWHWLDRFYYQSYVRWRESRETDMKVLEQRAVMVLGAIENHDRPAPLEWLPSWSPLRNLPGLRKQVEAGHMEVFFLVEPQELSSLFIIPGRYISTFAERGAPYQKYSAHVADLATRLKAIADPTRLKILSTMMHLELDNTQVAAFLQIARPTVSVHAKQLREAGLIETRREGRKARHTVKEEAVRALFQDLESLLGLDED